MIFAHIKAGVFCLSLHTRVSNFIS